MAATMRPTGERWLPGGGTRSLRRDKEQTQDEINVYLAQLLQLDQLRTAWTRLYQLLASRDRNRRPSELADLERRNRQRRSKP